MEGKQIVAVDVGSNNVAIAVGNVEKDGLVTIRGIVSEPIEGVCAGHIDNIDMASAAIIKAKKRIEKNLGIRISDAYAGISGDYLRCVQVTDMVYVQDEMNNGSNQITQRDIDEMNRRMKSVTPPDDSEIIIDVQPLLYKVDGAESKVPVGSFGRTLEATYTFILCNKMMHDRLRMCLQRTDIKVKKIVPNTIALHHTVATTDDMQEGTVIVDFGGDITDVVVINDGKIQYVASIPIGSNSLNTDIRSMSIPSSYIEDLKIQHGSAVADLAIDDAIVFQASKRSPVKSLLRKNLAIAIEARLKEIAELIRNEIKCAGCGNGFTPSLILTGGGSQLRDIETLFARELNISDVRIVSPEYGFTEEAMLEHISSPADATVASLLVYGAKNGSCNVAMRPTPQEQPKFTPTQPGQRPVGLSQHDRGIAQQGTTAPETKAPTNTPAQPAIPTTPKKPTAPIEPDDELPKKSGRTFGGWLRDTFGGLNNYGNKIIGSDEMEDF